MDCGRGSAVTLAVRKCDLCRPDGRLQCIGKINDIHVMNGLADPPRCFASSLLKR